MCLVKHLTVMFYVRSLVEIRNPVPASQAQFPQFRVINAFASQAVTNAVIAGHSTKDLAFFI